LKVVSQGFDEMTERFGVDSKQMLESLRTVSHGTVSNAELMQKSMAGIALTSGVMASSMDKSMALARAAAARGMGDVNWLFESMVLGVGRLSPRILDNLGLTVDLSDAYARYATQLGKTTEQLTPVEQKQAVLNEMFRQGEIVFGDFSKGIELATDKYNQMAVAQEELKVSLGGIIDSILQGLSPALLGAIQGTQAFFDQFKQPAGLDTFAQLNSMVAGAGDQMASLQAQIVDLNLQLQHGRISYDDYRAGIEAVQMQMSQLQAETLSTYSSMGGVIPGPNVQNVLANLDLVRWQALLTKGAVDAVTGAPPTVEEKARPARARAYEAPQFHAMETEKTLREYWTKIRETNEREAKKFGQSYQKSMQQVQRDLTGLGRDFQQRFAEIFKATQVTPEDLGATAAGKYIDKWDEAARRLRDIFGKGAESPWAALLVPPEVQAQGGEAVKKWALQTIKDFYAGLRPDLINWDAVKGALMDPMQRAVEAGDIAAFDQASLRITPEIVKYGQQHGVDLVQAYAGYVKSGDAMDQNLNALGQLLMGDPTIKQYVTAGQTAGETYLNALNATLGGATLTVPTITVTPPITTPPPANIPAYQVGGYVPHTGLAFLHAGERVIPAGGRARGEGAVAGRPVMIQNTFNLSGGGDVRRLARAVNAELRWQTRRGGVIER
jgi:hypothetical protein